MLAGNLEALEAAFRAGGTCSSCAIRTTRWVGSWNAPRWRPSRRSSNGTADGCSPTRSTHRAGLPGHQHLPYASVNDTAARHTLTAASASKAWNLPGMKCAQLVLSNDADAEKWATVGMMAEHGASNLGVVANTAAFSAGGQWLDDVLRYLYRNRRLLADLVADQFGVRSPVPKAPTWPGSTAARSTTSPGSSSREGGRGQGDRRQPLRSGGGRLRPLQLRHASADHGSDHRADGCRVEGPLNVSAGALPRFTRSAYTRSCAIEPLTTLASVRRPVVA